MPKNSTVAIATSQTTSENSSSNNPHSDTGTVQPTYPIPRIKPFDWFAGTKPPCGVDFDHQNLITQSHDISNGVQTVLELIEQNGLQKDDDYPPFLSGTQEGALLRLCIASLKELQSLSSDYMDRVDRVNRAGAHYGE